jgi:protease-4
MQFANVEGLTEKLGLDFFNLKAGRYKDVGSPFRPMSPEDKAYLQGLIDNIYEQFIDDVARNRKIPVVKLRTLAEGKVYTGDEAKQVGLVDEFGNLPDAIEKAGRLGASRAKWSCFREEGFPSAPSPGTGQRGAWPAGPPYPEPAFLPAWFGKL